MSDGSDQHDDRPEPPRTPRGDDGRPVLAITVAIVLLLAIALVSGAAGSAVDNPRERLGYFLGGAVTGLLLWVICYAVTIRRSSRRWQLASLVILVGAGLFIAISQLARAGVAAQADTAATRARLDAIASSSARLAPAGPADAGPRGRIAAAATGAMLADARGYDAALAGSGFAAVFTFRGLTRQSPALDHCDRIAALTDRAAALGQRAPAYLAAARAQGAAAVAAGEASQAEVDRIVAGLAGQAPALAGHWRAMARITGDGAALCRILARRNWYEGPGGQIQIRKGADLLLVNELFERLALEIDGLGANPPP